MKGSNSTSLIDNLRLFFLYEMLGAGVPSKRATALSCLSGRPLPVLLCKTSAEASPPSASQTFGSLSSQLKLLGAGVEPARLIQPGDFKSPVSTIPPSKQVRLKSLLIKAILDKGRIFGNLIF